MARKYKRLSYEDRKTIEEMCRNGKKADEIAAAMDVHRATIYHELQKVRNQLTKSSSLIPCICWNETAEEVANWLPGDTVKLIGRLQSREYEKLIEEIYADGVVAERVTETRTAYGLVLK